MSKLNFRSLHCFIFTQILKKRLWFGLELTLRLKKNDDLIFLKLNFFYSLLHYHFQLTTICGLDKLWFHRCVMALETIAIQITRKYS